MLNTANTNRNTNKAVINDEFVEVVPGTVKTTNNATQPSLLDVLAENPNGAIVYLARALPEKRALPLANHFNERIPNPAHIYPLWFTNNE